MKIEEIGQQPCPVAKSLAELGDAWSVLIVREAFYGTKRFTDFVKFTGAQKTVVSSRLKRLVEANILERTIYSEYPTRHNYTLTQKGRELAPVFLTLAKWGDKWVNDDPGPIVALTHDSCGHEVDPTLVCGHCGDPVDSRVIAAAPGPAFPDALAESFAARVSQESSSHGEPQ